LVRKKFTIKYIIKTLMDVQLIVAVIALAVLLVLNIYEITLRGLFNISHIWIQDISVMLMCWMLFPGFSKIVYDKRDIVITVLYDKLPEKFRTVFVDLILKCVVILFAIVFCVFSYKLIVSQYGKGTITARIPLIYYTSAVFLNAFSLLIINIEDLVGTMKFVWKAWK
jgi:TRAP-type C4-dicarboxylate transport system permease small subunit